MTIAIYFSNSFVFGAWVVLYISLFYGVNGARSLGLGYLFAWCFDVFRGRMQYRSEFYLWSGSVKFGIIQQQFTLIFNRFIRDSLLVYRLCFFNVITKYTVGTRHIQAVAVGS